MPNTGSGHAVSASIPMGCHAASSSHAQEFGFFVITLLTDHFWLNPGLVLTSDPCVKDPFPVKPDKGCQVLVNVRSHHRGWTTNAFTSGETEARDSEPLSQSAEAKAATGPCDSPRWDPCLGPHVLKPAEPLAWASMGAGERLSLRPPTSRWQPCFLLTTEKSH